MVLSNIHIDACATQVAGKRSVHVRRPMRAARGVHVGTATARGFDWHIFILEKDAPLHSCKGTTGFGILPFEGANDNVHEHVLEMGKEDGRSGKRPQKVWERAPVMKKCR